MRWDVGSTGTGKSFCCFDYCYPPPPLLVFLPSICNNQMLMQKLTGFLRAKLMTLLLQAFCQAFCLSATEALEQLPRSAIPPLCHLLRLLSTPPLASLLPSSRSLFPALFDLSGNLFLSLPFTTLRSFTLKRSSPFSLSLSPLLFCLSAPCDQRVLCPKIASCAVYAHDSPLIFDVTSERRQCPTFPSILPHSPFCYSTVSL